MGAVLGKTRDRLVGMVAACSRAASRARDTAWLDTIDDIDRLDRLFDALLAAGDEAEARAAIDRFRN